MTEDNRVRVFMSLVEFDRLIRDLSPDEARVAKIEFVREGIEAYWAEVNWRSGCQAAYWVMCLLPPLWLVLWYRGAMSRMAQHAFGVAIHSCRRKWASELQGADIPFDGIPDPPDGS